MTQPTDDLAAQMVREMLNKMRLSVRFSAADMADREAIMEAVARRHIEKAREAEAPNLFAAFRTTLSGDGRYEMTFKFPSMAAMHAADDEWRALHASRTKKDSSDAG